MSNTWPSLNNPYVLPGTGTGTPNGYNYYEDKVENVGFPEDDSLSLQQGSGTANLDIFYNSQFVSGEVQKHKGGGVNLSYQLERTPIIAGTLTGTINDELETIIQTFVFGMDGIIEIADIGPKYIDQSRVVGGTLNLVTGILTLQWNLDPGVHSLKLNYEVNMEMPAKVPMTWNAAPSKEKQTQSQYIDYLVDQLSATREKLYDAENKLEAIHKNNGGQKTLAELEVEMYNEYEEKLKHTKEYIIDKLDKYIKLQTVDYLTTTPTQKVFDDAMAENKQ